MSAHEVQLPAHEGLALRRVGPGDYLLMREMTYRAVYFMMEADDKPRYDLLSGEYADYFANWGREGDTGVVAVKDGQELGAAWYRHYSATNSIWKPDGVNYPEMSIALRPAAKYQRFGGVLLSALKDLAKDQGETGLSLQVDLYNDAARSLYLRTGFKVVEGIHDSSERIADIMAIDLV